MGARVKRSRHPSPGLEIGHKLARQIPGTATLKRQLAKTRWQRSRPSYFRRYQAQKAIFIRTPKNASTSLCEFIFPGLSDAQWPPHVSAEYFRAMAPGFYDLATVIAPMREPVARLVSAFNWYRHTSPIEEEKALLQDAIGDNGTFDDFMRYLADAEDLDRLEIMQSHHFRRQADFVTTRDGQLIVDYLFPVEDMRPGLRKLKELFGTPSEITRKNASARTVDQPDIPANVLAHYAGDAKLWQSVMADRLHHVGPEAAN